MVARNRRSSEEKMRDSHGIPYHQRSGRTLSQVQHQSQTFYQWKERFVNGGVTYTGKITKTESMRLR
ncbi:MAG: hypothetical protein KGI27_08175 [Thaumarchaeota archaeon]|nr:hypothetical protein [Nitrososphaerota archaeon]